jgi:hypothetical protein
MVPTGRGGLTGQEGIGRWVYALIFLLVGQTLILLRRSHWSKDEVVSD